MSLGYDFDIQWIVSRPDAGPPGEAEMPEAPARARYVALFRDPRTVAAVKGADPGLRSWLKGSGFGFTTYDSGAGPGRYPAEDEAARADVLGRLSATMKGARLKGADLNGFDMGAFLKTLVQAKPLEATSRKPRPAPRPEAPPARRPTPVAAAAAAPVPDIDAAFANPKAGARLPRTEDREPTLDDLMTPPAYPSPTAASGALAVDDLKFVPTVVHEPRVKSGIPIMPMIMIGAVMFFFVLFMAIGGSGGGEIVAR